MILVSACLLGINCKYSGDSNNSEKLIEYLKDKEFIIVCPEQLGGLSTPRDPSEIVGEGGESVLVGDGKVLSNNDKDVSDSFVRGAEETLKIAKLYNCRQAILKEGSPSCGSNLIYDGSFSGVKVNGQGVTTSLLRQHGISVISEKDI